MKKISGLSLAATMLVAAWQTGCGKGKTQGDSELLWVQSRGNEQRYAYLEERDIDDEFLFGMQIINTSNFLASALNLNYPSQLTQLVLQKGKLYVVSKNQPISALLRFDAKLDKQGRVEVDFASPGNDLSFAEGINAFGGLFTRGESKERLDWKSEGAPEVLNVKQTDDKMVVDVKYLVSGKTVTEEGKVVEANGSVVLRIFLARRDALTTQKTPITVAEARKDNFGFFSPRTNLGAAAEADAPIRKFAYEPGGKITFYLKNFPVTYQELASKALRKWNEAFGADVVDVKIAGDDVDVADPGYNVLKWINNGDDNLGWAGTAGPTFDDPSTGTVISGSAYINGDYLVDSYKKYDDFSRKSNVVLQAAIGNAVFKPANGESPVIPYNTNPALSFEQYIEAYYSDTITHEAGHIFGLRHNFKGSNKAPRSELSYSIMDYLPRTERALGAGVGRYDKEAIRYAYLAPERFKGNYDFCTDEDIEKQWDCLQGDAGEPIAYVTSAWEDGLHALSITPTALPAKGAAPFTTLTKSAVKILALKNQLPADQVGTVASKLVKSLRLVCSITPDASLTAEQKDVVAANLVAMRQAVAIGLKESPSLPIVLDNFDLFSCVTR